ncbi:MULTISPECIES: AAA family ATPase [Cyanophyceae]|uniref:AAA family ATPase n=1 Tax=Cyanophyceae TaxID=3028117 RepID=UPI00232FF11D|nr:MULTISPECIES: AAA family ATPase [Cyanophyceae]MDB9355418.1 AAA family ATPase [Nodularia spumigena CS-587/03]MDB9337753.1 AAA family ATPase [Nodularia spumigena CS-589/07]MDB9399580.1 AAA family ATPase [Microcystis aeruginosa CS-567/02-A1]MDB9498004.1 AAA family ATPase [Nodularia spumigena CS-336/02]MDB9532291.1 AAA family ATPase [Nodularia spumigena CS-1038]
MNQPLLRFLITKNYKNLSLEQVVELQKLNIFIGANNSGKSNFISCLKFLKSSLTKIPDENRGVSSFEDAISQCGGDRILDISVDSPARVRLAYCFEFPQNTQINTASKDSRILDIKIFVNKPNLKVSIGEEYLYNGVNLHDYNSSTPFYYYKFHDREFGKGAVSVYDEPGQRSTTHFEPLENIPTNSLGLATIPKLLEHSQHPPENTPVYKVRREVIGFVSHWQFYNANNMDLDEIRTKEPKIGRSDIYLSPSGDNLALVLDNLIQEDIDFEESINIALKAILPKSRRLRPIRSGRLSLTLELYFQDIKEAFYLNELSDGTVRMLCWATILHSPILPSLLVIDEPELGLHVSWMPILAEWIKKAARKTQVIITTHSPDLLDHFTDCLENVFCFYSEDKMHFSIKTLSPQMLSEKIAEGWQLGDLYRVGDPSIGGWPW